MSTTNFADIAKTIQRLREQGDEPPKIGFVSGNFNVVHPGHLRLLKFAADCCDILIVAIHQDSNPGVLVPAQYRLEGILAISNIYYAFVMEDDLTDVLKILKPDIVVKGKEHEDTDNVETPVLDSYGGKLIFSSGDTVFSSLDLIREEINNSNGSQYRLKSSPDFIRRHKLEKSRIESLIDQFSKLSVMVIGDLIIDEYITCDVLGLSREDPTIVITPIVSQKFIGGASIVASHAAGMGAKTCYVGVTGDDDGFNYATEKLNSYGVEATLFKDESRPTTLKQRYRADTKTMMRVNHLKQHTISNAIEEKIIKAVTDKINDLNLVIFSDFNYGVLSQQLINDISILCNKHNIPMVADSQSSSQLGDVSRFKNMMMIKPTEIEARLAVQDQRVGIAGLVRLLADKCGAKNILMTMASEGVLIHTKPEQGTEWIDDRLPAFNSSPKDTAGAGDAMLVASSMALAINANIWEAAYIGCVASGCQVGRVGNIPLTAKELKNELVM